MIEMICIRCPKGCRLKVDDESGYTVTGNECARGAAYGYEEATAPTRMVTSTVRIFFADKGKETDPLPLVSYFNRSPGIIEARLPVKTGAPIPKGKIMDVMKVINTVTVEAPIHIGDVLVTDIAGTGTDLVATRSMESV